MKAIFNDGSERLYRPHADRKPTDRIREAGAYIECTAAGKGLLFILRLRHRTRKPVFYELRESGYGLKTRETFTVRQIDFPRRAFLGKFMAHQPRLAGRAATHGKGRDESYALTRCDQINQGF